MKDLLYQLSTQEDLITLTDDERRDFLSATIHTTVHCNYNDPVPKWRYTYTHHFANNTWCREWRLGNLVPL